MGMSPSDHDWNYNAYTLASSLSHSNSLEDDASS